MSLNRPACRLESTVQGIVTVNVQLSDLLQRARFILNEFHSTLQKTEKLIKAEIRLCRAAAFSVIDEIGLQ